MNIRTPKLFLALVLTLALCACSPKEAAPQTAEAAGEAFLTEFFTANADGRYDTFSRASAIDEAAVTAYYEIGRASCRERV